MYQPILISSGLVGWQFLQRTYDQQLATFNQSAQLKRETDQFAENIASVTTAEELVSDRQMLTVALGAFGLQDDIDNRFFIEKILCVLEYRPIYSDNIRSVVPGYPPTFDVLR